VPNRWNPVRRVDPTYYTLFERAGDFVVSAADALHELFSSERIDEAGFSTLDDIERRADSNTHDLLARLERGYRGPFPEAETRRLVNEIDEIVDHAEYAGELAVLTGVTSATPIAIEMTELLTRISREVASLLAYIEQGDGYRPYVARIHELEHEGDDLWTRGFRELFAVETDTVTILKWKEIYGELEAAIDSCESTARLIDRVIARRRG
jgi:uncharacterized protein Yka (UPF0111/DUF47 family)